MCPWRQGRIQAGAADPPASDSPGAELLRFSRAVAEQIPGAEFVVIPGEAHQPFQERPTEFNALVDTFWRTLERSPRSTS